jgi:hypothetical protein
MPAVLEKNKTILHTVEEKNELAIKLLSLKDKTIVHALKLIFDDLTTTSKKASKAQYNKEINDAVKRVRRGNSLSNEKVMDEMDKW